MIKSVKNRGSRVRTKRDIANFNPADERDLLQTEYWSAKSEDE